MEFTLVSDYVPKGDQPQAIEKLSSNILAGKKAQILLGATGTGKTYTIANVIARVQKPTLVIAHNKTCCPVAMASFGSSHNGPLLCQLLRPHQPEAYVPQTDTYIEKDASIRRDR